MNHMIYCKALKIGTFFKNSFSFHRVITMPKNSKPSAEKSKKSKKAKKPIKPIIISDSDAEKSDDNDLCE